MERVLPVKVPGFSQTGAAGASPAGVEPALESEPGPEPTLSAHDAAARIDAARERLRATIEPPDDPEG